MLRILSIVKFHTRKSCALQSTKTNYFSQSTINSIQPEKLESVNEVNLKISQNQLFKQIVPDIKLLRQLDNLGLGIVKYELFSRLAFIH